MTERSKAEHFQQDFWSMSSMLTRFSGILGTQMGELSSYQPATVPRRRPGNTLQLKEFLVVPVPRVPASEMI